MRDNVRTPACSEDHDQRCAMHVSMGMGRTSVIKVESRLRDESASKPLSLDKQSSFSLVSFRLSSSRRIGINKMDSSLSVVPLRADTVRARIRKRE